MTDHFHVIENQLNQHKHKYKKKKKILKTKLKSKEKKKKKYVDNNNDLVNFLFQYCTSI